MAIFKKIADEGKYQDNQAIPDLIGYITRRDKTPSGFIGGVETDENDIAGSMMRVSSSFNKNSFIRLHHFIISFHPQEISSIRILIGIAEEICSFIGDTYQIVYAIHEDSFYVSLGGRIIFPEARLMEWVNASVCGGGIKQ